MRFLISSHRQDKGLVFLILRGLWQTAGEQMCLINEGEKVVKRETKREEREGERK